MDRVIISAAITHIRNAKDEIDRLPKDRMNQETITEVNYLSHSLDDSIQHFQSLFGPGSTQHQ